MYKEKINLNVEQNIIKANVQNLEMAYAELYHTSSDFDERLFLTNPTEIGTPSQRNNRTPMRGALEAVEWLSRITV